MEWRTNIPIITPNIRLRSVPNEPEYLSRLDVRRLSNGVSRNRKHPNLETEREYSPRLIQEPDAFSFHRLSNPNCTQQFVQLTHLHGTPKYNTRTPPFPRAQWSGNEQRSHERDYKFIESLVHVADSLQTGSRSTLPRELHSSVRSRTRGPIDGLPNSTAGITVTNHWMRNSYARLSQPSNVT